MYNKLIFFLKKNFLFNLVYTLLNVLFPVIIFSYVSRILGPTGIGKAQFIISVTQYFVLIAGLGIPFYGIREVARCKSNPTLLSKLISEILFIHFFTSLLLFIIFFILINNSSFFSKDYESYLLTGLLILFGFSNIDWFYLGTEQFGYIAFRSLVIKLISLLLVLFFIKDKKDYYIYIAILTFSYVSTNVWNIIDLLSKIKLTTTNLNFPKHFKPLLYIFSTSLAISLYQVFDTIILGLLSSETAVGLYTAAVKISKISLPLVISLGSVLIPRLSVHLNENNTFEFKKLVDKSFSFIVSFSLPICFGILMLSKELLLVFSGNAFLGASLSMQIVSFLTLVIGLSNLYGLQILTSAQKDKYVLISVVAGVISSLTINIILIPRYQETGAATATILSEVIVTSIAYYYSRKFYNVKMSSGVVVHSLMSSCLFVPIIMIIKVLVSNPFTVILYSVPISGIIYFSLQLIVFKNEILLTMRNIIISKIAKQLKN